VCMICVCVSVWWMCVCQCVMLTRIILHVFLEHTPRHPRIHSGIWIHIYKHILHAILNVRHFQISWNENPGHPNINSGFYIYIHIEHILQSVLNFFHFQISHNRISSHPTIHFALILKFLLEQRHNIAPQEYILNIYIRTYRTHSALILKFLLEQRHKAATQEYILYTYIRTYRTHSALLLKFLLEQGSLPRIHSISIYVHREHILHSFSNFFWNRDTT